MKCDVGDSCVGKWSFSMMSVDDLSNIDLSDHCDYDTSRKREIIGKEKEGL